MPEVHAARRAALAAHLAARDLPAALVTRLVNVRYLTGLDSSNACLLVRPDGAATLATDDRYALMAEQACPDVPVVRSRSGAADLLATALAEGRTRVGFEEHDVTVAVRDAWTGAVPGLAFVRLERPVERQRVVKDAQEITCLRRACELTDAAFADVLPTIAPGVTELEIARALEARMVQLGAEAPAFPSIVAAGDNGAIGHHHPADRPVAVGDLVTMDFGARYGGYHADMTRTVAVGEPADWQREMYDLVARAQRAGREALAPGVSSNDVDAAARDLITAAGHREHFQHGLGHGVGLEVHEDPFLSPTRPGEDPAAYAMRAATLQDGVPITIEPGVYVPGRGGVRIEDTLIVRDGGPELLTKTTKELLVCASGRGRSGR